MQLKFGVQLTPVANDLPRLVDLAVQADEQGLDLVGMQDHPYAGNLADTMAVAGAVLAATRRVHVFPDVANLPLRPAPLLAKTAATLDILSGGRFELGLGSGGYLAGVAGMGGPRLTARQALANLEQGVQVLRAAWAPARDLSPAHPIEIWLGMVGEQGLRLTGRIADGWAAPIPSYLPYERWAWANGVIDAAAVRAGRDPRSVRRVAQVVGSVTSARLPFQAEGALPIRDTEHGWVRTVVHILGLGFDSVVFWPEETTSEQLTRFAAVAAAASDVAEVRA